MDCKEYVTNEKRSKVYQVNFSRKNTSHRTRHPTGYPKALACACLCEVRVKFETKPLVLAPGLIPAQGCLQTDLEGLVIYDISFSSEECVHHYIHLTIVFKLDLNRVSNQKHLYFKISEPDESGETLNFFFVSCEVGPF